MRALSYSLISFRFPLDGLILFPVLEIGHHIKFTAARMCSQPSDSNLNLPSSLPIASLDSPIPKPLRDQQP